MTTGPFLALLLLIWGAVITDGSVVELYRMIYDVTGRDGAFNYGDYGCYCGLGGRGRPLDATDWCCHAHDCCYGRMINVKCRPKTNPYNYIFESGKVQCVDESWCGRENCKCDRVFTMCIKRHLNSYNSAYRFYPNIKCNDPRTPC